MVAGVEVDIRGWHGAFGPGGQGPVAASLPAISRNNEALEEAEAR